jgi:hypothetical protein
MLSAFSFVAFFPAGFWAAQFGTKEGTAVRSLAIMRIELHP